MSKAREAKHRLGNHPLCDDGTEGVGCSSLAAYWVVVHGVAGADFILCADHLREWVADEVADYFGMLPGTADVGLVEELKNAIECRNSEERNQRHE